MTHASISQPPIRVALTDLDGLLRSFVVTALENQHDMKIVDQPIPGRPVSLVPPEPVADVCVTSLAGDSVEWRQREVFFGAAGTPLVTISADGRRAQIYDRWEVRAELGDIVAAIREVARHREQNIAPTQTR